MKRETRRIKMRRQIIQLFKDRTNVRECGLFLLVKKILVERLGSRDQPKPIMASEMLAQWLNYNVIKVET